MKFSRYILPSLLACLAGIHLVSCEIEGSPNGDFDGFWHMERIDTIATQGVLDLSADRKFWAVQNRLIRINTTLFHFERTDGRLTLTEAPDAPSEPDLKAFGVQQIPETFEVELLNSKKMILKSSLTIYKDFFTKIFYFCILYIFYLFCIRIFVYTTLLIQSNFFNITNRFFYQRF